MAEPKDNLQPEEIQQIESLLSALNKNPQSSEDLNPMAKVLREKLGYSEPIQHTGEEEAPEEEDSESATDSDFGGEDDPFAESSEESGGPPPFRNLEADDDIDLDELLNEDGPKKAEPIPDDFDDFDSPTEESGLGDFETPTVDAGDADPFADLGGPSDTTDSEDPFGGLDSPAEEDPFASLGSPSEEDSASDEADHLQAWVNPTKLQQNRADSMMTLPLQPVRNQVLAETIHLLIWVVGLPKRRPHLTL